MRISEVWEQGGGLKSLAVFAVMTAALWLASTHSFLLFHSLAEMFSVVVAFAAFMVAWHSRQWIGSGYLLMLGVGHLFVGAIDIVHALAYKGMGVFPGHGGNLSSQLWLAGRGLEVATFLTVAAFPRRRYHPGNLLAIFAAVTAVLVASIFAGAWPATFVEGQGVTAFKVATELIISGLFIACLLLFARGVGTFDAEVRGYLLLAVAAKLATELAFISYVDAYDLAGLVGHVLKLGSAWLFLRAIVETGLRRPQAFVFGAMDRERLLSEAVARHASTLDAVLEATPDPVAMVDVEGRFRFVSRAAEGFFGRSGRDLAGKAWDEAGLALDTMKPLAAVCARVRETGEPVTEELTVPGCQGARRLEVQVSPVTAAEGTVEAMVMVIRDITVRKAMEEELMASLADNRVLMMEVHHRVKNNLQIVSSILQMQGWRIADPALRGQFEEACGRILSLATVHEMLYKQENPAAVDFVLYVRTLCDELFRMYGVTDDWVDLTVETSSLPLPLDKAVPLALIVHELVNNALKTAFRSKGGELRIRIFPEGDVGVLALFDNGITEKALDFHSAEASLGLRMVTVLVRQIHGSLAVDRDGDGKAVVIRFPLTQTAADAPLSPAVTIH